MSRTTVDGALHVLHRDVRNCAVRKRVRNVVKTGPDIVPTAMPLIPPI